MSVRANRDLEELHLKEQGTSVLREGTSVAHGRRLFLGLDENNWSRLVQTLSDSRVRHSLRTKEALNDSEPKR